MNRRLVSAITVAVSFAAAVSARQSPPVQPRFQTATELVTIDVVATRTDGQPASGLTAADFELFEDGVAQPIAAFQFVDLTTTTTSWAPMGVSSNADEPGALFAIVLDELGVGVDDVQRVRRAADRFLQAALQPQDYVAVLRAGANSGFFLTADRRLALDAVANSTGRRDRGLRLDGVSDDVSLGEPSDIDTLSGGGSATRSFEVLLSVVDKFRSIPARRKAILWFSRGGNIEFKDMDALVANRPDARDDNAYTQVIERARAANVAIYTVDPRGLVAPDTSGSGAPGASPLDELGTLRDLATATGGRAIVNANDIDGALIRVAAENRAYYLLGYVPTRPESLKGRRIEVRTRAAGVTLLHRKIYLPAGKGQKSADESLMAPPLPVRDLLVTLAPGEAIGARGRRGLIVPFSIGTDLPDGTELDYSLAAFDPSGARDTATTGRVKAANGVAVGQAQLPVTPQTYQLRLAATTRDGARRGLALATVHVAKPKSDTPVCGAFVFEQQGESRGVRSFTRDAALTMSTVVSAKTLEGLTLAFGLGGEGGPPQRTWPAVVGRPLEPGLWRIAFTLNPPLPRGRADVTLLSGGAPLGPGCAAGFEMQ